MLLFSCSQYEIRNQVVESTFNSELYDAFKKGDVKLFVNNKNQNSLENSKKLLVEINEFYGTDIQIPDNFFHVFLDGNINEIVETSLKNGWLNQDDINLFNELNVNINNNGFDSAIDVFKNQTLDLNLSDKEFSKKNAFVNMLEIIHYENPSIFEINYALKSEVVNGPWTCLLAVLLFIGAIISLASCALIFTCFLVVLSLGKATDFLADSCYQYLPN